MIVLSCNNISKAYVVDYILKDVNFIVQSGEKIGVVGNNGSGKTTLFHILSGETSQTYGEVYLRKDQKIGYLAQHTSIESDKSLYDECLEVFEDLLEMEKEIARLTDIMSKEENSSKIENYMNRYSKLLEEFTSKNGYAIDSEIKGTLKGLGFSDEDLYKSVNLLSGGQKSRLALAKLLLSKPDLLLLDEPTNHLDIDAINWLENYLNDYKGACLIISHDRYFLDNVVSKIFLIDKQTLTEYKTNYSDYMVQRKKDLELMKKQYQDQQKEINRQKEIIERFSNYGDRRYIKQAQARQKLLDKMEKMPEPSENQTTSLRFEPKVKSGKDVLLIEDLEKSFPDKKLFENVNIDIYRGEKVGLIGGNGVGKTSLFKMILDKIEPSSGSIKIGHKVNLAYFDQEQSNLNLDKTIIDEIWDEHPNFTHYQLRATLSKFLFVGDDIFNVIKDLSGGERGRLALLKLMLSDANFLLMDEPTNHLDIDSKEVLEDALINYEGTLFVISHDRYFLNRVVDRIIELKPEGTKEYLGNYKYYLMKKNEENKPKEEPQSINKTQKKLEQKKLREKKMEEKKLKQEIQKLEEKIFEKELLIEECDESLCKEEIYENPEEVLRIGKLREDTQLELEKLYKEWMDLTEE